MFLDDSSKIVLHTEQHWIFKNIISSKHLTSTKLSYSYFLFCSPIKKKKISNNYFFWKNWISHGKEEQYGRIWGISAVITSVDNKLHVTVTYLICGISNHIPLLWLACFMNSLPPLCSILFTRASFMLKLNYLHSSPYPSKLILQSQSVAYLLLRLCSNWRFFVFFSAICLRSLVYRSSLFLALCSLLLSTSQRRLY